jgi:hypothetical protein
MPQRDRLASGRAPDPLILEVSEFRATFQVYRAQDSGFRPSANDIRSSTFLITSLEH